MDHFWRPFQNFAKVGMSNLVSLFETVQKQSHIWVPGVVLEKQKAQNIHSRWGRFGAPKC